MNANTVKIVLITACLLIAGVVTTCHFGQLIEQAEISTPDTLFLSQWRREKNEKLNLIDKYEIRITNLQMTKDSLAMVVAEKKKDINAYRFKEKHLQGQLKETVINSGLTDSLKNTLIPLLDSLAIYSDQNDTVCNETIRNLEQIVGNRDNAIILHSQVEMSLKDLQKSQDQKEQYLTEQLHRTRQAEHKAKTNNKLLRGGILILTGIAATLIVGQSSK